MTPNDALMELLCMIDAAQGASAHRIIAVMPWYGYARQDKKSLPREPISARVVAKSLEAIGTDRVLTMDLHAGQVQGFFEVPVDHMTAMPMLTQWFIDQQFDEELVIVSPDAGRVKVARNFARKVGTHWAVMEKERPAQQVAEIGYVVGDVKGKTAVLVDDMIDTAGTLCAAAEDRARRGRRPRHRLRHPRRLQRPRLRAARLRELADRADRRHRHDPAAPRRARQHHGALDRADPRRLDPPDLHRRLVSARSSPARTSCSETERLLRWRRTWTDAADAGRGSAERRTTQLAPGTLHGARRHGARRLRHRQRLHRAQRRAAGDRGRPRRRRRQRPVGHQRLRARLRHGDRLRRPPRRHVRPPADLLHRLGPVRRASRRSAPSRPTSAS